MKTLRFWLKMAGIEALLVLALAAIAPIFINSNLPIIGLLIWLVIMGMVIGSGVYVVLRWRDAILARHLFITAFPDYETLTVVFFLDYSSNRVHKAIAHWQGVHTDPEFLALQMSPLEFLRGVQS
ncbi:MAG: hypothetical protein F6K30_05280 [Cyanothece sp. SIO2G6]|nr:hypothetical protein [Cyanothece sp. SIO2G6]